MLFAALMAGGPALSAQILGKGKGKGTTNPDSLNQDTTRVDTNQRPKKIIDPLTERIFLDRVEMGEPGRKWERYPINKFLVWNPTDSLKGFSQTLGQIGKPYRRYRFGAPSYYFEEGQYINPINLQEDAYVLEENQVRYYDTRTPYFNIQYHQGRRRMQLLHVTVSQNVTPWLNFTGFFRNRRVTGGYLENDGRHSVLYLSGNAHSLDNRYQAFAHWSLSELEESYNGGAFLDSTTSYTELFQKNLTQTSLQDNRHIRRQRKLYFKHFYQLRSDSVLTGQSLVFFNSVKYQDFFNQYSDAVFDTSLQSQFLPLYLSMDTSQTSAVFEKLSFQSWRVDGGGRYNLKFRENKLSVGAEVAYESYRFLQEGNILSYDRRSYSLAPILELNEKFLSGRIEAASVIAEANLFDAERRNSIKGNIELPVALHDYTDSTIVRKGRRMDTTVTTVFYRPVFAGAKFIEYSRNPSYLETYYNPGEGNAYQPNSSLVNRNFQHISGSLGWQGKEMGAKGIKNGRNKVQLTGFYSRQGRMIYRDTAFALHQAPEGEALESVGAELYARLKWRRWSIESWNTYQSFSAPAGSDLNTYFSDHLPTFYGKTGLYYENKDVNIAAVIRCGIEAYYNTAFYGEWFDPIHQDFYPQRKIDSPAYTRFDVFLSTRIKTALIYAKYVHANEYLFLPGYYHTPLYPKLEGTFVVGVNWTFFE